MLDHKEGWRRRTDAFELWCWSRLFQSPLNSKEIKPIKPKEIDLEYALEELVLRLKLQYFGHRCEEPIHWKRPWCWEGLEAGGEGDDRG